MSYPKYFATGNKNKLQEVNSILGVSLEQIHIDLDEIQAIEVEDVVKKKAVEAFNQTGKSVLVEDTGLYFEALNGFPGALIKWLLDSLGNEEIINLLSAKENRKAYAKTVFGYFDGKKTHLFTGKLEGTIPTKIQGDGGFGWDPLFIPEGHTKTLAEMTSEEKNAVSSRKIALEKLNSL